MASSQDEDAEIFGSPPDHILLTPSGWLLSPDSSSPTITLPTTTTTPITFPPSLSALIIIDMQNFFLTPLPSRPLNPLAITAEQTLLNSIIPSCEKAGMQIVHLTWGITEGEIQRGEVPAGVFRMFGMGLRGEVGQVERDVEEVKGERRLGKEMGVVGLENGEEVQGGKLLMKGEWNTELHGPLAALYEKSQQEGYPYKPHIRFHKARISGFSDAALPIVKYLKEKGIQTLLFTGVNTDQCVYGSVADAMAMGFRGVLVRDGCATGTGGFAREMVEWNMRKAGWVVGSEGLEEGVKGMR